MKTKRILALLLAVFMLVSVFAACGGDGGGSSAGGSESSGETSKEESSKADESSQEESSAQADTGNVNLEGYPIVKEPVTYSMMGTKAGIHGDWDKMELFQILTDLTGISFTYDTPSSEVMEEKKNLALNSGNYAEVLYGCNLSREQQVKYGSQGVLLPLEDYIDKYCPNILAMFEEKPDVRPSITAPDGHIYSLPTVSYSPLMSTAMWVNIDWLDALGVKPEDLPTDIDGFYDLMVRFRDEDPNGNGIQDEIPLNVFDDSDKGDGIYKQMMAYFGVLSPEIYVDNDGKIHYGMMDENAKVAFEFFHKMYSEKILSQEMYSHAAADATAEGTEGRNGAGYHALPRFIFGNMEMEKEATYPIMPALSSSVNPEQTCTRGTGITQGTFSLTNKCDEEAVIAMMRWVDYLYSEEGSWLEHYGPEGHIWEYSENDPTLHKYIFPTDGRNVEEVRGGEITPDCGLALPKWVRDTTEGAWDDVQQQARIAWSDKSLNPYNKQILPDMFLTEEEQAVVDMYATELKNFRQENSAKFVVGDQGFDQWDSFVDGMKALGVEEYVATYQQAYDRWASNK